MCVDYQLPLPGIFPVYFDSPEPPFEYPPEAFPGYDAAVVMRSSSHADERVPARAVFGLIPFFSKDESLARKCYNARSETIAVKPSFRGPWKRKQFCIIPAMALYEPNYEGGKPVRWRIHRKDDKPFAIAGIWDTWRKSPEELVRSMSMVTINAEDHPLMKRFHGPNDEKRSVVLLPPEHYDRWLDAEPDEAMELLQPFNPDEYTAHPAPMPPRKKKAPAAPLADDGAALF